MTTAPMRLMLASLVLLSIAGPARADGSLPDGNTLSFQYLYLHENNSKDEAQPQKVPDSLNHYFNAAHCICSKPGVTTKDMFYEGTFGYQVIASQATESLHQPMEVWVGAGCDVADVTTRSQTCHKIDSATVSDVSTLGIGGTRIEIPVFDLLNPEPPRAADATMSCGPRALAANEWLAVDTDMNGTPDYWVSQSFDTDTQPPPIPSTFRPSGAENGIQIDWDAPVGNIADIYAYQALCSKVSDQSPGRSSGQPSPLYYTPRTLCGDPDPTTADITLGAVHVDVAAGSDGVDASTAGMIGSAADLPVGMQQLDSQFICGQNTSPTATSITLEGLQNGVAYNVVLLSIDKFGNAAGVYFDAPLTPQPVTDFWEDLHDKGDDVNGGFCLVAQTFGDDNPITNLLRSFRDDTLNGSGFGRAIVHAYYAHVAWLGELVAKHLILRIIAMIVLAPLILVAMLWHVLTLPGLVLLLLVLAFRKKLLARKRLMRLAPVMSVLVVLGISSHAFAQAPYWEDQSTGDNKDEQTGALADEPSLVKWNVGLRAGPYTPAIDSMGGMKNSAGQGPYEAMFGGYTIMPTIDIDRFLWTGFGQLGVGLSAGYMGKTAHAYKDGSDPNDPMRPRSSGDETSFRMVPLELSVTYRLSFIDDEYNIPVFPYIRGGLAYYVWWMTAPDGSFSRAPDDPSNKARGASAGLAASVGIAIRAERIDADAARSMHESGLEHAGFYGEVSTAWVDGFGNSNKLSVGDNTFSAGINFEF